MGRFFKDEVFESQFLRTLGHAFYGGADVGECLALAGRLGTADPERWHGAWHQLAQRTYDLGQASFVAGQRVSAREAFLRASNYFRASYTFLFQAPLDPRAIAAYDRQAEAFARAMTLMDHPAERVAIPFEDHALHALFLRPDAAEGARRTLIVTGGYDGPAEENYFMSGRAALARGYNVLLYDGPGQGHALFKDGLTLRPDWEAVLKPVVDFTLAQPGVDSNALVALGVSLGGYLAPRAASAEPRLAALVADPGQFSVLEEARARLPAWIGRQLPDGNRLVLGLLGRMLDKRMSHVSEGWALRRGLLVNGCTTPLDFLRSTAAYTNEERAGEIACPTMVCSADADTIGTSARRLFDALTCEKRFQTFAAAEGAGGHCEAGARSMFNREMFDWLDTILSRAGA